MSVSVQDLLIPFTTKVAVESEHMWSPHVSQLFGQWFTRCLTVWLTGGALSPVNPLAEEGNFIIWRYKRHHNSTTVSFDDKELAHRIFRRIKMHIPQEVWWVDRDCSNLGLKTSKEQWYGKWTHYGVNCRCWRVVCYPGQGHFRPHRDGYYMIDEHHRSLITINGFLTDRPKGYGGATRFV